MACSLVFELHGDLVRCISTSCGLHFEGLGAAARHLGRQKLIDQHLKRKMLAIETAYNIVRHVTPVSASLHKQRLDSVLRSQKGDEEKKEEAAVAAAAAGGGDGGGGGGQGAEEGGGGSGDAHVLPPAVPSVLPPGLETQWAAERGDMVPAQLPGQTQETSRMTEDHGITRVEQPPGKEMVFACSSGNGQRPMTKAPPPIHKSFASASHVEVGLQAPAPTSCLGETLQMTTPNRATSTCTTTPQAATSSAAASPRAASPGTAGTPSGTPGKAVAVDSPQADAPEASAAPSSCAPTGSQPMMTQAQVMEELEAIHEFVLEVIQEAEDDHRLHELRFEDAILA